MAGLILVTGAGGQVAHELAIAECEHRVVALPRSQLDITNQQQISTAFEEYRPDILKYLRERELHPLLRRQGLGLAHPEPQDCQSTEARYLQSPVPLVNGRCHNEYRTVQSQP